MDAPASLAFCWAAWRNAWSARPPARCSRSAGRDTANEGRLATDSSPDRFLPRRRSAFAQALEIAKREGAELIVVHVLEPISPLGDGDYHARHRELRAAMEATARRPLDRLLARAKQAKVAASDVVMEGWPPEEIVTLARKRRVDLIVIGTHGRTGMKRLLLGSVAERVIVLAPCPVLAVRGT